jgi:hypothetical protein
LNDLSRKGSRASLPVRREPYWHKLETGAYLGFRRGPDTWIARFRDRTGDQNYRALTDVPRDCKDQFVAAKKLAESCTGKGYQTLINDALAKHLASVEKPVTAAQVRSIVREELQHAE